MLKTEAALFYPSPQHVFDFGYALMNYNIKKFSAIRLARN